MVIRGSTIVNVGAMREALEYMARNFTRSRDTGAKKVQLLEAPGCLTWIATRAEVERSYDVPCEMARKNVGWLTATIPTDIIEDLLHSFEATDIIQFSIFHDSEQSINLDHYRLTARKLFTAKEVSIEVHPEEKA